MKAKYKRLKFIAVAVFFISIGLWLILKNFNENIVFFFTPTELKQKSVANQLIRVGGLVTKNSITKLDNGLITEFIITDNQNNLTVRYKGLLPNLFRENQGIVAKGKLINSVFVASELLAKHDENYMPKEVSKTIKESLNLTYKK